MAATYNREDRAEEREQAAFDQVTDAVASDYADAHPRDEVEHVIEEAKHSYDDAAVRDFVPILVERDVRRTFKEESADQ